MSDNGTFVTNKELNDKLNGFRWEVRFLILAAIAANQMLPNIKIANAASHLTGMIW